jgi:hypothetical protein
VPSTGAVPAPAGLDDEPYVKSVLVAADAAALAHGGSLLSRAPANSFSKPAPPAFSRPAPPSTKPSMPLKPANAPAARPRPLVWPASRGAKAPRYRLIGSLEGARGRRRRGR